MSEVEKLIATYIKQSEKERLDNALNATKVVSEYLYACDLNKDEALSFFLNIVRLFVSADKKCGKEEYLLFKQIIHVEIEYEDFFEFTNGGASRHFIKTMNDIIDRFDERTKNAVCVIGLTIICSDGIVNEAEKKLLKLILDY